MSEVRSGGGADPVMGSASSPTPRTKRRPFRPGEILQAAVALFNERGYQATNMADIGAAVGITGPGIYRHFPSKQAIFETALTDAGERLMARVQAIVGAGDPPPRTLERLVDNYLDAVLEAPALSVLVLEDQGVLRDEIRQWGADQLRVHMRAWVDALSASRPELTRLECRTRVIGAFSMAYAMPPLRLLMPRDQVAASLRAMCAAILWGR